MKKLFIIAIVAISTVSCTDNQLAKHFGGTEEIKLKPNEIVLNVTWKAFPWKDTEMWICTKDTVTNITYFREKSNWDVMEGTVILK